MKIYPGTNVLLSGFFGSGLCKELLTRLLEGGHTLLIGEPVAREFCRIAKDKFRVAPADLSLALEVMRRQTAVPAAREDPLPCPDPDDAPILACAVAGGAEYFITGDAALLKLKKIGNMAILSPRRLFERLIAQRRG